MEHLIKKYAVEVITGIAIIAMMVLAIICQNDLWQLSHSFAIVGLGLLAWYNKGHWGKTKTIQAVLMAVMAFYATMFMMVAGEEVACHYALTGILLSMAYAMGVAAISIAINGPKPIHWADWSLKGSIIALLATISLLCILVVCNAAPSATAIKWLIGAEMAVVAAFIFICVKKDEGNGNTN